MFADSSTECVRWKQRGMKSARGPNVRRTARLKSDHKDFLCHRVAGQQCAKPSSTKAPSQNGASRRDDKKLEDPVLREPHGNSTGILRGSYGDPRTLNLTSRLALVSHWLTSDLFKCLGSIGKEGHGGGEELAPGWGVSVCAGEYVSGRLGS